MKTCKQINGEASSSTLVEGLAFHDNKRQEIIKGKHYKMHYKMKA
jgi:hypothetical protein